MSIEPDGKVHGRPDASASHAKSRQGRRSRRRKSSKAQDETGTRAAPPAPPPASEPARAASAPHPPSGKRSKRSTPSGEAELPGPGVDVSSSTSPRPSHGGHDRRRTFGPTYAALDLGTNNCRLLIATPTRRGQFKVVDAFSRIVKLGQGLGHGNALGEEAMDRAVGALKLCAAKLSGRPIRRRRLIATEACRRAENGVRFIDRVKEETGLALEVVDRQTEAYLAVAGCASLIERDARGVVLFDIGGGSTEIALLDLSGPEARMPGRAIAAWTSLPVGVVTLSERYEGREVTSALFERMVEDVSEMLAGFEGRRRLRRHVGSRHFHLLGTSGTVTTLAGLHLRLPRYDRRRVDGLWMRAEDVDRVQAALVGSTFSERRNSPCIGNDRADLVLAGCAILEAIRREWPSDRLRVADRGLREGMLSDMMVSDDAWNRARGKHR